MNQDAEKFLEKAAETADLMEKTVEWMVAATSGTYAVSVDWGRSREREERDARWGENAYQARRFQVLMGYMRARDQHRFMRKHGRGL